jgi:hypothetical protein
MDSVTAKSDKVQRLSAIKSRVGSPECHHRLRGKGEARKYVSASRLSTTKSHFI